MALFTFSLIYSNLLYWRQHLPCKQTTRGYGSQKPVYILATGCQLRSRNDSDSCIATQSLLHVNEDVIQLSIFYSTGTLLSENIQYNVLEVLSNLRA